MPGKSRMPARGRSPAARPTGLDPVGESDAAAPAADAGGRNSDAPAAEAVSRPRMSVSRACPVPEPRFMLEPALFSEMRVSAEKLPERAEDRAVISRFVMGMETVAYARSAYPTARTAALRGSIDKSTAALHQMIRAWLRGSQEPLEPWVVELGAVRFTPEAARQAWLGLLEEFRKERDPFHRKMHLKLREASSPDGDASESAAAGPPAAPFHSLEPFAQAVERQRSVGTPSTELLTGAMKAAADALRGFAEAAIEEAAKPPRRGRARAARDAETKGEDEVEGEGGGERGRRRPRCVLPAPRACPLVKDVFKKAVKAKLAEARREARYDVVFRPTPPGLRGEGGARGLSREEYAERIPEASPSMHRLALLIMFQRAVIDHVERRRMHHAAKGYAMVESAQGPLFEYMKRNRLQRQRLTIRPRSSDASASTPKTVEIVLAAQVGSMLPDRPALRMGWAWRALDELMGQAGDVFEAPLTRDSVESLADAVATRVGDLGDRFSRGFDDILDEHYMARDDKLVGIFGAEALEAAAGPAAASSPGGSDEADAGGSDRAATRASRATARSRAANSLIGVPGIVPMCDVPVVMRLVDVKPRATRAPRPDREPPARRARPAPVSEAWKAPFSW